MIKIGLYKYGVTIRRHFNEHDNIVYIIDYLSVSRGRKSKRCMGIEGMPGYYSCIPFCRKDNTLLIYEYCQFLIPMDMGNSLILGGAGGTVTRYLLKKFPYAIVDVVEINEFYIQLSKKYFLNAFKKNGRLNYYNLDAKIYVDSCVGNRFYDFIFCDLFDKNVVIDLVFKPNFQKAMYSILSDKGVLVINLGIITVQDVERFMGFLNNLYPYKKLFKFGNSYVVALSKSDLQSICKINQLGSKEKTL